MAVLHEIVVPLLAVNDNSLSVVDITFQNGQSVRKGDLLMVFETSKTTYDVIAEFDGYIEYKATIGNDYAVNTVVARIHDKPDDISVIIPTTFEPIEVSEIPSKKTLVLQEKQWEGETVFSAAAVELIKSRGLDSTVFSGYDLVAKSDVEKYLGIEKKLISPKSVPPSTATKKPDKRILPTDDNKVVIERLSSNKKREIEFLSQVQSSGLTSTINIVIDTEGIFVNLDQSLQYLKGTLLPVIIYESGRLLKKFPLLNAYFTGESIALYNEVNVGFAIDIDKGLKVLKVAATNERSLSEIENSIMELSDQYIDDKLSIEVLTDITFTITDLSSEGVSFFRPLVNMMNSAILGVSAIDNKLKRCTLSLTFDHHVTEGKYVAQFLSELKSRIESYRSRFLPNNASDIICSKCFKKLKEDLSGTGFVRAITPKGEEGYLCQSCVKGF